MNEKHNEVHHWLAGLYVEEPVPQYEINPSTVQALYNLMKKCQRQEQAVSLVIDDLKLKAKEYSLEAERLSVMLNKLGLSVSSLSQSGTVSVCSLISTALLLNTKDASTSNVLLAMSEMSQEAVGLSETRKIEQRLCSQIIAKTKAALVKNASLHKTLTSLQEQHTQQIPELEKKIKITQFLEKKALDYHNQKHKLQNNLKACGVDPSLYHSSLVQRSEELQQLRDRLHPIRAKLDSYHKLPPDLSLVKVKIEEAKRELMALESELAGKIDMMHM